VPSLHLRKLNENTVIVVKQGTSWYRWKIHRDAKNIIIIRLSEMHYTLTAPVHVDQKYMVCRDGFAHTEDQENSKSMCMVHGGKCSKDPIIRGVVEVRKG
jgi:hypothetical protein